MFDHCRWFELSKRFYNTQMIVRQLNQDPGLVGKWSMEMNELGMTRVYISDPKKALMFALQWSSIISKTGHPDEDQMA